MGENTGRTTTTAVAAALARTSPEEATTIASRGFLTARTRNRATRGTTSTSAYGVFDPVASMAMNETPP
ncbi:hypothetical protein ACFOEP_12785 [Microbacterium amylolyticum]|uniref:hypothetical protein n=1 Tax=Microbacterium amylolyticum TaxID=936337 RepID=UPI003607BFE9